MAFVLLWTIDVITYIVNIIIISAARRPLLDIGERLLLLSFSRARSPLFVNYLLGTESIKRVDTTKDLGVIFDSHLNFHTHMRTLATDCYRKLGFVIRNAREFDPLSLN
jgi:hypothetical protein